MLERELETYKRLLPSLLQTQGGFAVITGDDLLGVYVSYEDALKVGYDKCGLTPFLVKKIAQNETVAYFTRSLVTACPA